MWIPPMLIVPLIIYNIAAFGLIGPNGGDWNHEMFAINMVSGGSWALSSGDLLILLALVMLFIEVLKSTSTGAQSVLDHALSAVVFVIYLVEFLVVESAASSVFFACLVMSFIDLVAGFSVSIRAAGRDVNLS